jgi:peptide/nickel transport system substrate-binding protein
LNLTLLIDPEKQYMARLAELVKDYLEAIGLKIDLKAVERSSWVNLKDNYRYDMIISRTTPWGMVMHANWGTGYFDTRRSGEGVMHTVDDPAFLEICDGILSTLDEERLETYAHRLQDYYSENLPAIALFWNIIVTPYNRTYSGWVFDHLYGLYNIDSFLMVEKKAR